MPDLIIIAIVVIVVGIASWYMIKEKKKGKKCIGCPYNSCCNKECE